MPGYTIENLNKESSLESDLEELFQCITSWGRGLKILTPNLRLKLACEEGYALILDKKNIDS